MNRRDLSLILLCATISSAFASQADYDKRVVFAEKLAALVQKRATKDEVLKALGKPYRREVAATDSIYHAWLYATKPTSTFPNLGTIIFGKDGQVSRAFGSKAPSGMLAAFDGDLDEWLELIASTPGVYYQSFDSKKVVSICSKLVRLPIKDAMGLLEEYTRLRPKTEPFGEGPMATLAPKWHGNDGQVGILLLTLFAGDKELGRDVFPSHMSLKSQHEPSDPKYLGELVIWKGWPVVIPCGHIPTSGESLEPKLMAIAKKKTAFSYRPPQESAMSESEFRDLWALIVDRLQIGSYTLMNEYRKSLVDSYKKSFATQLGLKL